MAFRCLSLLTLLIVMYAIHAEPRALRAFSIIGCILDLDHLEEALRKKSPGFDATLLQVPTAARRVLSRDCASMSCGDASVPNGLGLRPMLCLVGSRPGFM